MQSSTHSLAQQVYDAVIHNPHLKQRPVHFNTDEGKITIQGSVESYFEKQMAQEAVRHIEGIQSIENQLEVRWSYGRRN
jgi:osmotically-inducible protein OsmY